MACRIIVSAPVPFPLDFGFRILDLDLGLDLGLTIMMMIIKIMSIMILIISSQFLHAYVVVRPVPGDGYRCGQETPPSELN